MFLPTDMVQVSNIYILINILKKKNTIQLQADL